MRARLVAVVVVLVVVAFGCADDGPDVGVSGPRADSETATTDAAGAPVAEAETAGVVRYQGLEFVVPPDWPVHDLAAEPTTCVRFDVHAVYLGSPSPDMQCAAQSIGRADAVLVEPGSGVTQREEGSGNETSGAFATTDVNGLSVAINTSGSVEHELVVAVPSLGVTVTLSFGDTDAVAQQIIASMRAAS